MGTHHADGSRKSSSPPVKFDPKQVFIAISMTRAFIAEEFNVIMENEGWKGEKFEPDDPRLTDAVCQDVADNIQSTYSDLDEVVDVEYEYNKEDLRVLLGLPAEDEENEEDEDQ